MKEKLRTHRSTPRRLNAVGPMKKIGVSLVRKKVRISDMLRSVRRGASVFPVASVASVAAAVSADAAGSAGESGVTCAVATAPAVGSAVVSGDGSDMGLS